MLRGLFWLSVVCAGLDRLFRDDTPLDLSQVRSGVDYERFCAQVLEKEGWQTSLTQASGDQGVDIIATRPGFKLAIQCKFYKDAVGNKAVQEITAGRIHVGADGAAVICASRYTESAYQLSSSTGVILITHDEIPDLVKRLALHEKDVYSETVDTTTFLGRVAKLGPRKYPPGAP